jgi:hypothetical integral membrane protein (TIGR02206 family)
VPLFGAIHNILLAGIVAAAVVLGLVSRRNPQTARVIRLTLGIGIAVNELIWWTFRYSHEGFRFPNNLPLQLCDVTLWAAVVACLSLNQAAVGFCYFAGIAGAGMALLTPDLWSPWPSYPAVYFFVAHGGIVIAALVLVYGRVVPLQRHAAWRAFGILLVYAAAVGLFNKIFGTNYMYLCDKPKNASLLDMLGIWPFYLAGGAALALSLFFLLWIPTRQLVDS